MSSFSSSCTSLERAKIWSENDPNEITASAVKSLIHGATTSSGNGDEVNSNNEKLAKLFPSDGSRIGFGTAGLRGPMQPGPLGMNDLVIIQTSQGLARYCQEVHTIVDEEANSLDSSQSQLSASTNKKPPLVVIGYDHRCNKELNLSSKSFAVLTQLVFRQAGFECVLFDGFVPTPLVAFSTVDLKASIGIMITASHNPKVDDGFKVYWNDGVQIRPPLDKYISESILKEDNLVPWVDYASLVKSHSHDKSTDATLTQCMIGRYYDAILKSGLISPIKEKYSYFEKNKLAPPKIAYTAMHGVGYPFAVKSFQTFGLEPFLSVPSQQAPDPLFPTVPFPNPEEKGALSLAQEFAQSNNVDIILANDPDADRLAVAERCRDNGTWTVFTGDQIGAMLGHWIYQCIGKNSDKPIAMCASTVSSKMLGAIAEKEGFHFEDTLTGFKWIASRSAELRKKGYKAIFSYEEAIGFCCGDFVFDKDGLTAMGVMAELALSVYKKEMSLKKHMDYLYDTYGYHHSKNGYFFCYDNSISSKIIEDMRNGGKYLTHVGPYEIESIRDLGYPGYDSTTEDKKPTLPVSRSSPIITLRFVNGCVAQFRSSGTEPKFKYYIEMRGKPGVSPEVVSKELDEMVDRILSELLKPEANGLVKP